MNAGVLFPGPPVILMYVEVAEVDDVPEDGGRVFEVEGVRVAVFRVDGGFYAIDNTCTHAGGSLGDGGLRGCTVMCPRHGAEFDVRSGEPLDTPVNPADEAVKSYEVRVGDGVVSVELEYGGSS